MDYLCRNCPKKEFCQHNNRLFKQVVFLRTQALKGSNVFLSFGKVIPKAF